MKYVDLHVHSTFSDGSQTPERLVYAAYCAGLAGVAITDHDTMGGLPEARAAGKKYGIEVIGGVEVSTNACRGRMHILGYYVSPLSEPLRSTMRKIRDSRYKRLHAMMDKLEELGIPIDFRDDFPVEAGHSLGRPHIAVKLKERGIVHSIFQAFYKYLGDDKPAFVPKWCPEPEEVVDMIHDAGGLAVLAHPGSTGNEVDEILPKLIDVGLDGIEALYPQHDPQVTTKYRELATKHGLVITGGSDYHGENSDKNLLGVFKIKYPFVEALKSRHREQLLKNK